MNLSIWKSLLFVLAVALLLAFSLDSGFKAAAGPDVPIDGGPPAVSGQQPSTGSQDISVADDPGPAAPGTDSQGNKAQPPSAPGDPLDDPSLLSVSASARYYHIPGSALTPVDNNTTMVYNYYGCFHTSTGAGYLLNAPLDIPPGSHIVLLRMYYYDTSASHDIEGWITRYNLAGTTYEDLVSVSSTGSSGLGSSYGNLDHYTDTYNYSYVLNVRLNAASTNLQICGFRVMYYAPMLYGNFMPIVKKSP